LGCTQTTGSISLRSDDVQFSLSIPQDFDEPMDNTHGQKGGVKRAGLLWISPATIPTLFMIFEGCGAHSRKQQNECIFPSDAGVHHEQPRGICIRHTLGTCSQQERNGVPNMAEAMGNATHLVKSPHNFPFELSFAATTKSPTPLQTDRRVC
jgi:hypothetical protein